MLKISHLWAIFLFCGGIAGHVAAADQAYAKDGAQKCLSCHDFGWESPVHNMLAGAHGNIDNDKAPMQQRGCEDCHGPSANHTRAPTRVSPAVSFGPRWSASIADQDQQCAACHQDGFIEGHYYQYDAMVRLYNEKFGKPATKIYGMLKKKGLLARKAGFSNEIDWEYWELWHHEGRRARMGAAMMAPDYTWWHGIYDVAHNFYFKLIPTAQKYGDKDVNAYIKKLLETDPMHNWLGKDPKKLKEAIRSGKHQKVYEKMFKE